MTIDFIEEKQKRVMKLLEEAQTFKEIAQKEHVSFSFISMVNKKRLGIDLTVKKQSSIPTQALKLFSEGKSVIEVIIILDKPYAEICKYHDDYLRLKNRSYLISLIEAYQDTLPTIVKIIKYLIQNPSSKDDLIATLALVKDKPRLRLIKKNLEERIDALNQTKNLLTCNKESINQFSY
jgi:hypothetical protein